MNIEWYPYLAKYCSVGCRSPEEASVKQKMLYSSSKEALRLALGDGLARDVQANDLGDLDITNVLEIIGRNDRF